MIEWGNTEGYPPATDEQSRDRLIWPDVIAATKMGDGGRYFAEVQTNNNDTAVKIYIYWYTPEDGGTPVLMIEMDDERQDEKDNDVYLRVRRNDGLLWEGTMEDQEYRRETDGA